VLWVRVTCKLSIPFVSLGYTERPTFESRASVLECLGRFEGYGRETARDVVDLLEEPRPAEAHPVDGDPGRAATSMSTVVAGTVIGVGLKLLRDWF
jgi:hypothetical protein